LRAEFERVFAAKCSRADALLVVYVAANDLAWSRLGIITSKRVGSAVQRNYARRRIREAFRRMKSDLPTGYDIVCIARADAAKRALDVAASLEKLVLKAVELTVKRATGSTLQSDRHPDRK